MQIPSILLQQDCLEVIASFCESDTLAKATSVCKAWNKVFTRPHFWERFGVQPSEKNLILAYVADQLDQGKRVFNIMREENHFERYHKLDFLVTVSQSAPSLPKKGVRPLPVVEGGENDRRRKKIKLDYDMMDLD